MSELTQYRNAYEYIALNRDADGVLTMRLHDRGGKWTWGMRQQEEITDCMLRISHDRANKIVILTGTGDVFVDEDSFPEDIAALVRSPQEPKRKLNDVVSQYLTLQQRMIQNHLGIEVPMIGVLNGPAACHAELVALCDIVLAADHAYVQDFSHFICGIVPGDGLHIVWPELLGANRGRYFLMTGQKIYAEEARELGVVAEVMPRDKLEARAKAIAADLARRDHIMLRHTRALLVHRWRKLVAEKLLLGLYAAYGNAMGDGHVPIDPRGHGGS
jgi:enoyl-CoA hydratase/carnithine racemase